MINALGGIPLNINTYIPIGGVTDQAHPAEGLPQARTESEAQRTQRAVVRPGSLRFG